jgi:F0F1-type ATP synthase assembly protein I
MVQQSSWGATVGTAIALQWAVVMVLAMAAWLLGGAQSAKSLLYGGGAVALPNTIFAFWLTVRVIRKGSAGAGAMLGGEMLKLGLTIALLAIVVSKWKPELDWLALIVGLIGALKAQWLALWVTRRY